MITEHKVARVITRAELVSAIADALDVQGPFRLGGVAPDGSLELVFEIRAVHFTAPGADVEEGGLDLMGELLPRPGAIRVLGESGTGASIIVRLDDPATGVLRVSVVNRDPGPERSLGKNPVRPNPPAWEGLTSSEQENRP